MVDLILNCVICSKDSSVTVRAEDLYEWSCRNKLSQEAFPYLSKADREMIQSQICPTCWEDMFGQGDEDEDEDEDE